MYRHESIDVAYDLEGVTITSISTAKAPAHWNVWNVGNFQSTFPLFFLFCEFIVNHWIRSLLLRTSVSFNEASLW